MRITLVLTIRHLRSKKLQALWHLSSSVEREVPYLPKNCSCKPDRRTEYFFVTLLLSLYIATAGKAHLSIHKTWIKPIERNSSCLQQELTRTCHAQRTFYQHNSSVRAVRLSVLGAIAMLLVRVTDHGIRLQKKKKYYPSCRAEVTCLQQFISVAVWAHFAVHAHQAGHTKFI